MKNIEIEEIWMYDIETELFFHYVKNLNTGNEYENGTIIDREIK